MGWLYPYDTYERKDMIKHILDSCTQDNERSTSQPIKHCCRGNVLWIVFERHIKASGDVQRVILCCLMQKDDTWGYKDMDESAGPIYYTCPLSYLAMVPEQDKEWREGVREYRARRKKQLAEWRLRR